ncbi:UbiA prenyltransferase [Mycena leptocephala]|nr:UbiA prenyltransferase [Mycena leptocephala]
MRVISLPTATEVQGCWELCRLHNNIGFWVVWLPTSWSIAMVYRAQPELSGYEALVRAAVYVPLCFGVKSLIMTIDDLLDYDIDALVERTRNRPLPVVQYRWDVLGYSSGCNLYTSMAVWPLHIIYPTCKGLMFKVGIFMGWSDLNVDGSIPWNTLIPIYLGTCLWTITYETVYQHQVCGRSVVTKIDDLKIGINSPALLCRGYTIPICIGTALGFIGLLTYGGMLNNQGIPFYVSVAVAGVMLLTALLRTDVDCPGDCKRLFLGTPLLGKIILSGLVIDAVLHRWKEGVAF